ncbi:hypothetical protein NPIL_625601 [Nephila pilipes]|uniref:Uncharacterized protein n=1 Tax=Nephila pilipes TaxID=299642 RepID=A0A8X6PN04_NEPPI|nr:hypothetical protein NPIL_625601 [Nephila pilipes]
MRRETIQSDSISKHKPQQLSGAGYDNGYYGTLPQHIRFVSMYTPQNTQSKAMTPFLPPARAPLSKPPFETHGLKIMGSIPSYYLAHHTKEYDERSQGEREANMGN